MRKALVLMMTTCILFAGCIEGLTEDVEEVVEELAPGCNDPTALNYNENDTTATTCITEETLHRNIGEFVENSESEDSQAVIGFKMTMSGVDEEMGMGAYTMVSTTAENENTVYSGTELTIGGMALTQSWTVQENGDGTILQASYMGESFLMYSAMSWEDVSDDCDDSDDRDCVDAEISQEDCERRGGTWIEVTDRPIDGYCNFDDSGDRGDGDFEITQEECEERGGTWNVTEETDGREANNGTRTCDTWSCEEWCMTSNDDDDSEITQEDCERRGGNWTAIEETEGRAGNNSEGVQDEEFYCDFREESDREEDRDDDDATDSSEEQDRGGDGRLQGARVRGDRPPHR